MIYGCRDVLALISAEVDSPGILEVRDFARPALSTASRKEGGGIIIYKYSLIFRKTA